MSKPYFECKHRSRNCSHKTARKIIAEMNAGTGGVIEINEHHWREIVSISQLDGERCIAERCFLVFAPTGVYRIVPAPCPNSKRLSTVEGTLNHG
jgi:hypothetical protein